MATVKLITFDGEYPRTPAQQLPDNAAAQVTNLDVSSGNLEGIKDLGETTLIPPLNGERMISLWTEDGDNFFAWPWETDVVKGQVVDDLQKRIFYTGQPTSGNVIKVARTVRDTGLKVIGNQFLLGGRFRPPETTNVGFGGNNLGPDSWVLGTPALKARDASFDDKPTIALIDRPFWPGIFNMKLRVTFFLEDASGAIVWQKDISNTEAGSVPGGATYPSVAYTNSANEDRGNKIQDMLWPLGYTPRPFKYYFFIPPDLSVVNLARTVTVTNNEAADIVITFASSVVDTSSADDTQKSTQA